MATDGNSQIAQTLENISTGDITAGSTNISYIVQTSKLRNSVLRKIVAGFRDSKLAEDYIVNLILAFDEAAEKGLIDEQFLVNMRDDPEFLSKIAKK